MEVIESPSVGREIRRGHEEAMELHYKERQKQALTLRTAGATYSQIADQLGYASPSGAHQAVKKALDEFPAEAVDELRTVEKARLESMLLAIFPKAQKGELGAIDRVLKISERIASLHGLDAPQRIESRNLTESVVTSITIEGDSTEYIKALRAARGEIVDEPIDVESIEIERDEA